MVISCCGQSTAVTSLSGHELGAVAMLCPQSGACVTARDMQSTAASISNAWGCREQDRRTKTENTRRETERLLRGQQAELEAKTADMARRDVERNTAREAAAAQANSVNVAAKAKVRERISACMVCRACGTEQLSAAMHAHRVVGMYGAN